MQSRLLLLICINILMVKTTLLAQSDCLPIGTIIYSIVPPDIFEVENPGWKLMQGQKIDSSSQLMKLNKIRHFLKDTLPNPLGDFIRTSNYNGRGYDSDGTRIPGYDRQLQGTKKPTKDFTFNIDNNDHAHSHFFYRNGRGSAGVRTVGAGTIKEGEGNNNNNYKVETSLENTGNHKISIDTGSGDPETRPNNISLFLYIKID